VFERFTDRARRVLVLAQEEARLLGHGFIGTEHLLLGLIREEDGIAAAALRNLDISLVDVRLRVEETIGLAGSPPTGSPPFTPRSKKVLELSLRAALQLGHTYIGTEHMLLGIVQEGEGVAARVLVSLGADLSRVRQQVMRLLTGYEGAVADAPEGTSPEMRTPGGRIVACSFCGRAPPESGQLVSGANAFICEQCIRRWSRQLERQDPRPSWRSVTHQVRQVAVTGPPPDDADAARVAITAAFASSGTESEDGRSVPTVEGGETLGPTLTAAKERRRDVAPETAEVVFMVDEISFIDATHAAVWFSISVNGASILPNSRGDAVIVDGEWKMSRSTFCELMGLAGVPCPPIR
jgi:Clp amino terminal domain, pathogenicity island component/ClpX C4-type zinc finger